MAGKDWENFVIVFIYMYNVYSCAYKYFLLVKVIEIIFWTLSVSFSSLNLETYRACHEFGQAKFSYGGSWANLHNCPSCL